MDRDSLLALDESRFAAECVISAVVGSGPGGQHRNKTATAIRAMWRENPAFVAEDCTERSQARNRSNALKKLKFLIACGLRNATPTIFERKNCAVTHPDYPRFVASLLDCLTAADLDYKRAAQIFSVSPSAFLKLLKRDPTLWQFALKLRAEKGLPPWR